MKSMKRKRALLVNIIQLEERQMEVIKNNNRSAQKVITQMEREVDNKYTLIDELEGGMRLALTSRLALKVNVLQDQRRFLLQLRKDLAESIAKRERAAEESRRILAQMQMKQKKLNKLYGMVDDVSKCIGRSLEQKMIKENDELWIQASESANGNHA